MKGPCEVTQLWDLATTGVKLFKLDLDPDLVFAQIRMMHFFTNCRTCLRGSVVSSRASLDLYPPTLATYLDGRTGVLDHEDPYV
jgi:hypothetical protein